MDFETITSQFHKLTENPESFLGYNEEKSNDLKRLLKTIYDTSQKQRNSNYLWSALPQLMIQDFDTEQIWQQIEVQNNEFLSYSTPHITKHVNQKGAVSFEDIIDDQIEENDGSDNDNNESEDNDSDKPNELLNTTINVKEKQNLSDDSDFDDLEGSDDENMNIQSDSDEGSLENNEDNTNKRSKKRKASEVDDNFFNLEEMERFLDNEDKKEMLDNDDQDNIESDDSDNEINSKEIDFFAPMSDDDMEDDAEKEAFKNPRFKDFFVKVDKVSDKKKVKRNKYLEDLDELSGDKLNEVGEIEENDKLKESNDKNLQSGFDQRQERLNKKISLLENLAISAKPWQLKGEITAESRPENSLLENVLEFDMSTRPAPVITEETTVRLEDIIRQRIQDRVWDSVQRKEKPVENVHEYRKQLVMDGEKSKLSLTQIYEKDYLKETQTNNEEEIDDKEKEEDPAHKEIREMITSLVSKLDALSNYHFTPKFVNPELKVVTNLAAISMEEVAPLAASDAVLLAPEEVQMRNKGKAPIGLNERSGTDKKRQRRMKKRKQKAHAQIAGKGKGIAENKYTKEKAKKVLEQMVKDKNVDKMTEFGTKAVKSSTAFFEQLQVQVKSTIKGKLSEQKTKKKTSLQAKKFKL